MFKLILGRGGRNKIIFAGICILAGIPVFVFFDQIKYERVSIFGIEVLHYCTHTFGRYGFSGFYVVAGLIIGLWGFLQYKRDKQNSQQ